MRFLLILFFLVMGGPVLAACPVADGIARSKGLSKALPIYLDCALQVNDDDTQLYLAQIYETGKGDVARNIQRALLFYHLSSENGNATSMVRLSQLLTRLDEDKKTRSEISAYMDKMQGFFGGSIASSFSGQLLHPYALLVLAAEKPSSKWFYLSNVKTDPNAALLLKSYQIEPEAKQQVIKEATLWKQGKIKDIAREVFSVKEYNQFYDTLYPENGMPDPFKRSQAINKLKERIESKRAK